MESVKRLLRALRTFFSDTDMSGTNSASGSPFLPEELQDFHKQQRAFQNFHVETGRGTKEFERTCHCQASAGSAERL